MAQTLIFKELNDTRRFGKDLAESLKPGDVIALTGDLGAGKTALAASIAEGLGITQTVTSPTFTIVQEYEGGRLPFYHFDVYRVSDEDELFEIGFWHYIDSNGVSVIEWADLIEDLLPERTIRIRLSYGSSENERICEIC